MASETALALFSEDDPIPPAGHPERFTQRWRLIGAGLSNVWRYGDLALDARSGRLLLRGPNGTGKTTALEALWPYLLDLNPQRLAAGKARPTSLASLMREGAISKRRCGYAWLTLAAPNGEGICSYGVRLLYTDGGSPSVRVTPFMVPGVPLQDFRLYGPNREFLIAEQFSDAIETAGGQIFTDEDAYITHLALRLWRASDQELRDLASRIRAVRNPTLLGDVSPAAAAEALRDSLPGVSDDVVGATADALAESETTRKAFERDRRAADELARFAEAWAGHVTEVVSGAHTVANAAAAEVTKTGQAVRRRDSELKDRCTEEQEARGIDAALKLRRHELVARVRYLEGTDAFRDAGRLADLKQTLTAQQGEALAVTGILIEAARAAAERGTSVLAATDQLRQDIDDLATQAVEADSSATVERELLTCSIRPRAVYQVGDSTADPGPLISINVDLLAADETRSRWNDLARQHRTRAADAQLALSDHREAAEARTTADEEQRSARSARVDADKATAAAEKALRDALSATNGLVDEAHAWCVEHPVLAVGDLAALTLGLPGNSADQANDDDREDWQPPDLDELRDNEPAQIIAELDTWAGHISGISATAVAAYRQAQYVTRQEATRLRGDAGQLRSKAKSLRGGQLLPIPRPHWSGEATDDDAFAAIVDWHSDHADDTSRALIELALSASGILGATVETDGVHTAAWSVTVVGDAVDDHLGTVLTADPRHPLASIVTQVLRRIRLTDSALDDTAGTGLIIGRDGTFRIGPLRGRPELAAIGSIPAASHVGARQRREAAVKHAQELELQADTLDAEAERHDHTAADLGHASEQIRAHARTFPSRESSRARESERAAAAARASVMNQAALDVAIAAAEAEEYAAQLQREWQQRTAARGLPVEIADLARLRDSGDDIARRLDAAAARLGSKIQPRLKSAASAAGDDLARSNSLANLHAEAKSATASAAKTEAEYRQLTQTAGLDAERIVSEHGEAQAELQKNQNDQERVSEAVVSAAQRVTQAESALTAAKQEADRAGPHAAETRNILRDLTAAAGVADVLFAGSGAAGNGDIITAVGQALVGRRTTSRRTLRERYDECRAELAGLWSLDPGESTSGLDLFVLTHDSVAYSPPAAAQRALHLKQRAQAALDIAEESALRDFVIGRLPSAIGTAWLHIHDWVKQVNAKMKKASASSGVGVRISMRLSTELTAAAHIVYHLSCEVGDSQRTVAQQTEVGIALQALIAAADGGDMAQRLSNAVDVRQWVDIYYEIIRPDGQTQRWTSKTGLSGGERRLIVLAPMLAAIAAFYDQLDMTGLRLAALDEVPAEVDERGREGLARYIAELDLDLICTSYLWDGAPGAWDGIDAWDLEAAPDNTVVAFPMLVRGAQALPDDTAGYVV